MSSDYLLSARQRKVNGVWCASCKCASTWCVRKQFLLQCYGAFIDPIGTSAQDPKRSLRSDLKKYCYRGGANWFWIPHWNRAKCAKSPAGSVFTGQRAVFVKIEVSRTASEDKSGIDQAFLDLQRLSMISQPQIWSNCRALHGGCKNGSGYRSTAIESIWIHKFSINPS